MRQSGNFPVTISKNTVIGIYGAGGFAREVMPLVTAMFGVDDTATLREQLFFIETIASTDEVNGFKLLSEDTFFALPQEEKLFNVAIADSMVREKLANRCIERGAKPLNIISEDARFGHDNKIADGLVICPFSILTSNVEIGCFFHAYMHSYIAHDCVIGDYVTFGPRVSVNGNVHIKKHAYIGACAVIKQGTADKPLIIGEGAIVGMGAVVTKDVPPYTTVVGNPAKPMQKR